MDFNIVEMYEGKLREDYRERSWACREPTIYEAGVTRPSTCHVQPCHYIIPLLDADHLGCIHPYKSRNGKETIKQPFNVRKLMNP